GCDRLHPPRQLAPRSQRTVCRHGAVRRVRGQFRGGVGGSALRRAPAPARPSRPGGGTGPASALYGLARLHRRGGGPRVAPPGRALPSCALVVLGLRRLASKPHSVRPAWQAAAPHVMAEAEARSRAATDRYSTPIAFRSSSLASFGFAFPFVCRITCPTRKPMALSFPWRISSTGPGLAAITS